MCYSAMTWADYRSYERFCGAILSITEFVQLQLFKTRLDGVKIPIPKAMEDAFTEPANAVEREIKSMIDAATFSTLVWSARYQRLSGTFGIRARI